ncbi:hypothetical protein [Paraglaciecola sp. MB-3u-78]|uniref:hypothetical protein n=1 Tax=Paraglaciecola sp. MB-3u-78 TaxID=2058332 RepID=UPI001E5906B7|nr:hypothetical protein [Paraglaciecola sp. MB-3u-78]
MSELTLGLLALLPIVISGCVVAWIAVAGPKGHASGFNRNDYFSAICLEHVI